MIITIAPNVPSDCWCYPRRVLSNDRSIDGGGGTASERDEQILMFSSGLK